MNTSPSVSADKSRTLYLVDISSFIFRAFFAIRALSNRQGEPTNAIYGVATMLAKLIEEAKPEYLSVVYDSPPNAAQPSFRKQLYADYKANRSAPPDDLVPQFTRIEQLVSLMRLPSCRLDGCEADDLIATLAREWRAAHPENRVVVVSGDKDLMQLVDDRLQVWDTMAQKFFGLTEVVEKFGLGPELVRDYLALVGDSSDNIPGVAGIGPKGAVDLLKAYGSLEGVLKAAHEGSISGKKGEVLRAQEKEARLSATLATLKDDCTIACDSDTLRFHFEIGHDCLEFLREMDFHTLVERWKAYLPEGERTQADPLSATRGGLSGEFRTINTEAGLREVVEAIRKKGEFGFDVETTSLNPREAELCGISLCFEENGGVYIPVGHRGTNVPQLPQEQVLAALKPLLEDARIKKIGQNLKYDMSVMLAHGIRLDGIGADTMVAAYVLQPEGRHNLSALARDYLNYTMLEYEAICGKGKDQIGFDQVAIDVATRYSAEDAWIACRLWDHLRPRLQQEGLMQVFAEVDLPLVPVLTRMEWNGVAIDEAWLKELSSEFAKDLRRIEEHVATFTRGPVNLNSPKQLGVLLFDQLGLPPQGKTKTGYSTDASVLEALAPLHEVPRLLLEYREISKLKGTYVDPLPLLKDRKTGRIHASFHQTVAATGRLSSSEPNLQNIPIRSERGRKIRRAFVASPGCVLVGADYSQIELRLLAHMSGDPELVRSFVVGEDVHRRTASELFGVAPEQVDDQQRSVAKAINFGLMYGKTAFGLSQELKIPRKEAQATIDRYFERYHGVKKFLDSLIEEARERGYVTTLLGRKRVLADIHSKNPALRANAERMAMNTPIQGTAADLMKLAMIELDHQLSARKLKALLICQVHDEVLLDCPQSEAAAVEKLVIEVMEGAMKLQVPLKVNSGQAANWMEL